MIGYVTLGTKDLAKAAEFYDAIAHNIPPVHDGEWSQATLEVCLAILGSAGTQSEVLLQHQVGLRR